MAKSTGPIIAVGVVTMANQVIFNEEEINWRIPVATGLAAMLLSMAERGWERGAVSIAWLALVTSLFVRPNSRTPSPIESAANWWASPPKGVGSVPPNSRKV